MKWTWNSGGMRGRPKQISRQFIMGSQQVDPVGFGESSDRAVKYLDPLFPRLCSATQPGLASPLPFPCEMVSVN